MKTSKFIITAFIALHFCGCKKQYVCECSNPGGKYKAFSTRSSKSKADQKCKDYYDENFGSVIMSETYCEVK